MHGPDTVAPKRIRALLSFLLLSLADLMRPSVRMCVRWRQAADQALATERQRCSGLAVQLAAAQQQLKHMQVR